MDAEDVVHDVLVKLLEGPLPGHRSNIWRRTFIAH